jgi:hypothetical protein
VRDANGQQIAYIYYSNEPDRRTAAKLLTRDEARRIAANIAKRAATRGPRQCHTAFTVYLFCCDCTVLPDGAFPSFFIQLGAAEEAALFPSLALTRLA